MGDPLGSSHVSSQKQNCEGVVGAQSEQYRATAELSLGYGGGPGFGVATTVRPCFYLKIERFLRLFNSDLKLSESENLEVMISDTVTKRLRVSKFFLVGKAKAIGDNRILFSFDSEVELCLVLKGSPWFFGKSLLMLAKVKGLQVSMDVPLREQCFWARIHGLPPPFMTREMGEIIGVALGMIVQVECVNDFCFREYMGIRVAIDVFKPLCHGVQLRLLISEGERMVGVFM
ncbi:hypothetical protein FF2_037406 [Malus domestica]